MSDASHSGGTPDAVDSSIQNIKARIVARATAGQQFMIIVIGLGITAAIGNSTGIFKIPVDGPKIFILSVFLLYAVRFFFNNWLYMSESYDESLLDDLEQRLKTNGARKSYFLTVLRCVNFDVGLAIFTGLACALIGTLIFVAQACAAITLALIVHYGLDASIMIHNARSRWLEKPAEYAFNITRVICWFSNNLVFTGIFLGMLMFASSNEETLMIIVGLWMVNSFIALGITGGFALAEARNLRRSFA